MDLDLSLTKSLHSELYVSNKIVGPKLHGKRNKRRKDSDHEDCVGGGEEADGRKKMRTTFTGKQIFELEKSFESKKYLSSAERAEMASSLNVTQQQVG